MASITGRPTLPAPRAQPPLRANGNCSRIPTTAGAAAPPPACFPWRPTASCSPPGRRTRAATPPSGRSLRPPSDRCWSSQEETTAGSAALPTWPSGTVRLSSTDSTGPTGYTPTWNKAAGETAALYNTPIYGTTAGHGTAMNAYGAAAINQLFMVYAQQNASMAAPVTTASGSLDWTYIASGLTAGSGVAGQLADGMYFVQLDSAGGGVETVLPGDANLDGQVDVNDLTIVLSHFGQTGMSWAQGEITGDGTVNVHDLTIVLSHFGQTLGLPAADAAAVPEPACRSFSPSAPSPCSRSQSEGKPNRSEPTRTHSSHPFRVALFVYLHRIPFAIHAALM